jgi:maltodextrin utilization protein YvdJ
MEKRTAITASSAAATTPRRAAGYTMATLGLESQFMDQTWYVLTSFFAMSCLDALCFFTLVSILFSFFFIAGSSYLAEETRISRAVSYPLHSESIKLLTAHNSLGTLSISNYEHLLLLSITGDLS